MGNIYRAFDTTNSKSYVGQTWSSLEKRKTAHLTAKRKYYFHHALFSRPDAFHWTIIATAETQEELDAAEKRFVSELNTLHPNGYNLQDGGQGIGKPCEETRRKMSIARKGKKFGPMSERGRKNLSIAHLGKTSPWKGKIMSAEYREKLSKAKLGKKASAETRAKMTASQIKRWAKKRADQ